MNEAYLIFAGVIVGTVFTSIGVLIGGNLVRGTYMELTQAQYPLEEEQQQAKEDQPQEADGYDWDEYTSNIKNGINQDDEIIEN